MIKFKYESDMYPIIKKYFINKNKLVMEQVKFWNNYADTMAFDINWRNVEERLINQVYEKLDFATYWQIIFTLQENNNMTINEIANSLNLSVNYVKNLIKDLRFFNVVDVFNEEVKLLFFPKLIFNDAIVIESKLKDWKTCLKQAYYYNNVCNRLYMAFPINIAQNIVNDKNKLNHIKKKGVGIYGIDGENVVKLLDSKIFYPNPILKTQLYVLNEQVWGSVISNIKCILSGKNCSINFISIDQGIVPIDRLAHLV